MFNHLIVRIVTVLAIAIAAAFGISAGVDAHHANVKANNAVHLIGCYTDYDFEGCVVALADGGIINTDRFFRTQADLTADVTTIRAMGHSVRAHLASNTQFHYDDTFRFAAGHGPSDLGALAFIPTGYSSGIVWADESGYLHAAVN